MNPWRWVDPRVSTVRVVDLKAYFTQHGWRLCAGGHPSLLRFEAPATSGPGLFQMVPGSEQVADYQQRVTELLTTLSEIEDRPPVAILEEILRSEAPQSEDNGTVRPPSSRASHSG
jgi:hypothetical protein